jgi:hypothetical protein
VFHAGALCDRGIWTKPLAFAADADASWLNQVERWFAEITRKRIRRGTFGSVRDLVKAIQEYIRDNNKHPRPFQWVAGANTIVRKVRKYKRTLETGD